MKQCLLPLRRFIATLSLLLIVASAFAGNELTVFPNPASDNCSIRYVPANQNAAYQVVDVTGTVVRKGSMNPSYYTSISLNDLPGGIYLVNITDGDKTFTAKLIKQ